MGKWKFLFIFGATIFGMLELGVFDLLLDYVRLQTASEAFEALIEYSNHLHAAESGLKRFHLESQSLLQSANILKPAVEEFEKIKKEVAGYGNKVPPQKKTFKRYLLATLEKITRLHASLLQWESQYRDNSSRLEDQWWELMDVYYPYLFRQRYGRLLYEQRHFLDMWKFYFVPLAPEIIESQSPNSASLNETITIIKDKLLPLLKTFENIKIEKSQSPHFQVEDPTKEELKEVLEEIQKVSLAHGLDIQRVSSLLIQKFNNVLKLRKEGQDVDLSKVEIASKLEADIVELKRKIKKLQHPEPAREL